MGILVSAAEAAELVHHHERQVRARIARGDLAAQKAADGHWQIDTEALARVPGWRVDPDRLAALELKQRHSESGIARRLDLWEAQMRGALARIRKLEQELDQARRDAHPPETPEDWLHEAAERQTIAIEPRLPSLPSLARDALAHLDGSLDATAEDAFIERYAANYHGPPSVKLVDRGPENPQEFATHADAARWMERHGVNARTPKSWPGWRHVELTPTGVLRFALALQRVARAQGNWRVSWRLRRCDDPACVCQQLLADG